MAFNELEKQRIEKIIGTYCENRVPQRAKHQVKLFYKLRGEEIKIIESRPHWQNHELWTEMPIARLKQNKETLKWELFWHRANKRWEKYPKFKPTNSLKTIVNEIESDPYHVFWG